MTDKSYELALNSLKKSVTHCHRYFVIRIALINFLY